MISTILIPTWGIDPWCIRNASKWLPHFKITEHRAPVGCPRLLKDRSRSECWSWSSGIWYSVKREVSALLWTRGSSVKWKHLTKCKISKIINVVRNPFLALVWSSPFVKLQYSCVLETYKLWAPNSFYKWVIQKLGFVITPQHCIATVFYCILLHCEWRDVNTKTQFSDHPLAEGVWSSYFVDFEYTMSWVL